MVKQMKEFKTKSELYAEYVRLKEKYEPEPSVTQAVIEKNKRYVEKISVFDWRMKGNNLTNYDEEQERERREKLFFTTDEFILYKKQNNWSKERYELKKLAHEKGLYGKGSFFIQYNKWKEDGISNYKLHNKYLGNSACCAKCKKPFDTDSYAPLCSECYEEFGYYRIKGNEENFKKFIGKDLEIEIQLPKGKCLIKL
tara:strand:- start:47 stop:640 length:594 start_codon:yes stop_codon:yes gene_type:complete